MKLIRFGRPGEERPGLILPDGRRIDASGFGADYDQSFFESDGLARLARWGARAGAAAPPPPPRRTPPGTPPLPAGQNVINGPKFPGSPRGDRPGSSQKTGNILKGTTPDLRAQGR